MRKTGAVLLWLVTGVFYAIGWITRKLWFPGKLWFGVVWAGCAIADGWTDAARSGPPDTA